MKRRVGLQPLLRGLRSSRVAWSSRMSSVGGTQSGRRGSRPRWRPRSPGRHRAGSAPPSRDRGLPGPPRARNPGAGPRRPVRRPTAPPRLAARSSGGGGPAGRGRARRRSGGGGSSSPLPCPGSAGTARTASICFAWSPPRISGKAFSAGVLGEVRRACACPAGCWPRVGQPRRAATPARSRCGTFARSGAMLAGSWFGQLARHHVALDALPPRRTGRGRPRPGPGRGSASARTG